MIFQNCLKLRMTILKYHKWYLCQISLQIMFLPIPVLVCASIVVLRAISFIFQQSDVRRCVKIVQCLSLFELKCDLYCLQIKERNSVFQVFSWWDGAKRCVQEKEKKTPLLTLYFLVPFDFTSDSIREL